jgi:hypothetical protein
MAEDYDYNPGKWSGHDFKSARAHYDSHAGRSYAKAKSTGVTAESLVTDKISTSSTSPLVIMVDVTGSMGSWPATMFSKLPYLEIEGKEYLGADMEIAFGAVGDATCDKYPVQVRPFTKGIDLKDQLEQLVIEGGGGGGSRESYELGAIYYATNCDMPNAIKPIFIFVADESPYPHLDPSYALEHAKVGIENSLSVGDVFDRLKQKFSVYLVHKPYHDGGASRSQWVSLLGEDHIADLQDPNRVVDVIFGVLAKETGRTAYFKKEIEDRQDAGQVDVVYKSLKTIHRPDPDNALVARAGKSTLHRPTKGKKSRGLL